MKGKRTNEAFWLKREHQQATPVPAKIFVSKIFFVFGNKEEMMSLPEPNPASDGGLRKLPGDRQRP